MLAKRIGVDAGTSSCLVEVRGEGLVVDEPSVVAWDRRRSRIVAVGREALRMGARSGKLDLVRPFRQGAIADLEVAQALLVHLIGKVTAAIGCSGRRSWSRCRPRAVALCAAS